MRLNKFASEQPHEGAGPLGNGGAVQPPRPPAPDPPRPPLLVTEQEVARLLRVSPRLVWGLAKAGELRAIYLGRSKRYALSELEAFIRRRLDVPRKGGPAA